MYVHMEIAFGDVGTSRVCVRMIYVATSRHPAPPLPPRDSFARNRMRIYVQISLVHRDPGGGS